MVYFLGYNFNKKRRNLFDWISQISNTLQKKGIKYSIFFLRNKIYKTLVKFFLSLRKKKYFEFQGKKLAYLYLKKTFANERAIEIPIIQEFLNPYLHKKDKILEVGNVLSEFSKCYNLTIVDKYEMGKSIINKDICKYKSPNKYPLIVSISTLEHVGWDEKNKDPRKILKSIQHIKNNLLTLRGVLVFTVPIGYNTFLDELIKKEELPTTQSFFFKRVSLNNKWEQTTRESIIQNKYGTPYECANAIMVGVVKK